MASPLTATGVKSSYLYLLLSLLFAILFIYLWFIREPSIKENLNENAFVIDKRALENAIYLANVKFVAQNSSEKLIDVWIEQNVGLDFNEAGYPIGTMRNAQLNRQAVTLNGCMEVWLFIFRNIMPIIDYPNTEIHWAKLSKDNECVYLNENYLNKAIVYNPENGSVKIELATVDF